MDLTKILFEVKRIIYRDEKTGFTIANVRIVKTEEDREIPTAEPIVAGNFNVVHEKDEFKSSGYWVDTGENGHRFNIKSLELVFPETEKGMIAFIVRFAAGVGQKTATSIVNKFKENTFNIIVSDSEELMKVKGMTEARKKSIHDSISKYKNFEEVLLFLSPLGLSYLQVLNVYENLGISALHLIRDNPYVLYKNSNLSFSKIDNLAYNLGHSYNKDERIKVAILNFIEGRIKNRGDMYTLKSDIVMKLNNFLNIYGSFKDILISQEIINKAIDRLVEERELFQDVNKEKKVIIYKTSYKIIENNIVDEIKDFILLKKSESFSTGSIYKSIIDFETRSKMSLAGNQKKAITMALNNKISVLNGGPGTGKTQTINAIIECFKSVKPLGTIELAAPTGRAAKRMTELSGREAKTIHRLIGVKGFTIGRDDELDEIEADLLIIDEASMIDAYIFYRLLGVISEKTKLLIVGDYRQLPSVGAGLILRDLVDSNVVPVTTLNEVFRQKDGSQIIDNAYKIINGKKDLLLNKDKEDFYFIEELNKERISEFIMASIRRLLKLGSKMDDIQVLSVMNKGDLGVNELNRKIQNTFNPRKESFNEVKIDEQRILRLNDKVMQTTNNYDLNVFNGEIGKVTRIEGTEVEIDFGDKDVIYNEDTIEELVLAYAITVHKSQGSEFKNVIMPIHKSLNILLNRNIIYTGVTRAKDRVILIGDKEEFNKGIDNTEGVVRNSMIKDKLIDSIFSSDAI